MLKKINKILTIIIFILFIALAFAMLHSFGVFSPLTQSTSEQDPSLYAGVYDCLATDGVDRIGLAEDGTCSLSWEEAEYEWKLEDEETIGIYTKDDLESYGEFIITGENLYYQGKEYEKKSEITVETSDDYLSDNWWSIFF